MKTYGTIFILLFLSATVFAKNVNFEEFNKEVISEIDSVIEHNPELYNTKNLGRTPASVQPKTSSASNKLDEIEEQASGQKSW